MGVQKQLLMIVHPGVAEWEVVVPIWCLTPEIDLHLASTSTKDVIGKIGLTIHAHYLVREVNIKEFGGIYLPGGVDPETRQGFNTSLGRNEELLNLLRAFAEEGKLVAAICGAPLVLGAAGLLDGRHFASDITTDAEGWFEKGLRAERLIALDGNILTASVRAIFPFCATILRWFGEEAAAKEFEEFLELKAPPLTVRLF